MDYMKTNQFMDSPWDASASTRTTHKEAAGLEVGRKATGEQHSHRFWKGCFKPEKQKGSPLKLSLMVVCTEQHSTLCFLMNLEISYFRQIPQKNGLFNL